MSNKEKINMYVRDHLNTKPDTVTYFRKTDIESDTDIESQTDIESNTDIISDTNKESYLRSTTETLCLTNNDTIILIKLLMDIIEPASYDDWLKNVVILKFAEKKYKYDFSRTFVKFSKTYFKFDNYVMMQKWTELESYDIGEMTIATLHTEAKKCDPYRYKNILRNIYEKYTIEIDEHALCKKIEELAGHHFFYKNGELCSFDTKTKLWHINYSVTLAQYIDTDLYTHVESLLCDIITDKKYLNKQKKLLKARCKTKSGQKNLMYHYRIIHFHDTRHDIKFDTDEFLLGFTNGVFDLKEKEFRDYRYTDYITTNTGYAYQRSTKSERDYVNDLINKIEFDGEKQHFLLQILSSALIGKMQQKFIIFGGDSKFVVNRFMTEALGNYAFRDNIQKFKANCDANPQRMMKKRYVTITESKFSKKFNNVIKNLIKDSIIYVKKFIVNKYEITIPAMIVTECDEQKAWETRIKKGISMRYYDYQFKDYAIDSPFADVTDDIIQRYKCAFIDILIESVYDFINIDNLCYAMPKPIGYPL